MRCLLEVVVLVPAMLPDGEDAGSYSYLGTVVVALVEDLRFVGRAFAAEVAGVEYMLMTDQFQADSSF